LKNIQIISVVEEDAIEAGYIYKKVKEYNLKSKRQIRASLADVMLLAVGKRLGTIVVFSDNEWELIDLPGIKVLPFR
jgi:PIN domain nuclease of toxin-antitoxin system